MEYITVAGALAALRQHTPPITDTETVPVAHSLGRTLSMEVTAVQPAPPFARSAMDGYAIMASQTPGSFRVAGQVNAGEVFTGTIKAGEAVRIMTGAPVPRGLDAVAEQEAAEPLGDLIRLAHVVKTGRNVTALGSEFMAGTALLHPGQRIGPLQVGLMALAGYREVSVFRKPRVLLVSSGDELKAPGDALGPGQIYNVNVSLFSALLHELGAHVSLRPTLADDPSAVADLFAPDLSGYDVVLTTGGVSVGDKDRMVQFLHSHTEVLFWHVDMHPGKSIAAARHHGTTILALSGNPGAALMSWYNIGLPFLASLLHGHLPVEHIQGRLLQPFHKRTRETRFLRARIVQEDQGTYFDTDIPQASDRITTYDACDVLAVIPRGSEPLAAGCVVEGRKIPGLGHERLNWVPRKDMDNAPH